MVEISGIRLGSLTFPGRAGELQRLDATAALVRELGDNYPAYNAFLAEQMRELGGDPHPDDYRGDYEGYIAAATHLRDLVAAEMLLRRCEAHRRRGRALSAEPDRTPVVDEAHRIVSIVTGRRTLEYAGSSRRANERPAPPPDVAP